MATVFILIIMYKQRESLSYLYIQEKKEGENVEEDALNIRI